MTSTFSALITRLGEKSTRSAFCGVLVTLPRAVLHSAGGTRSGRDCLKSICVRVWPISSNDHAFILRMRVAEPGIWYKTILIDMCMNKSSVE